VNRGRCEGAFRSDVPVRCLLTVYFALVHAAGVEVPTAPARPGRPRSLVLAPAARLPADSGLTGCTGASQGLGAAICSAEQPSQLPTEQDRGDETREEARSHNVFPLCAPAVWQQGTSCTPCAAGRGFQRRAVSPAQPLQREGQRDDTADYQTAYQSARTVGSTEDAGDQSAGSGPDHLTDRLSMAWKTSGSSLLSPTCLGRYRIFGRSMDRTLMLAVCCHPGAGGSHRSICTLSLTTSF
jgi:hypothetical protein